MDNVQGVNPFMPESEFDEGKKEDFDPETESLWESLGIRRPDSTDKAWAPLVDHELILKLVRNELTERESRGVYKLIHYFQNWTDDYRETLASEFRRKQGT